MADLTLNQTEREQFRRLLSRSKFGADLFETVFNAGGDLVHITFTPRPDFIFAIRRARSGWEVTESPGETFVEAQEVSHADFAWCRNRVGAWVQRIDREFAPRSTSSSEVVDRIKADFFKFADSVPKPEQPFNADEFKDWSARLDGVLERLEKLEEDQQLRAGEVDELRTKLDLLKDIAPTTPRQHWLRAVGTQLINTVVAGAVGALAAQLGDELGGKIIGLLTGGPNTGQ